MSLNAAFSVAIVPKSSENRFLIAATDRRICQPEQQKDRRRLVASLA